MGRWISVLGISLAVALTAVPALSNELTKTDVDAWLDGFMPYAMERGAVPGAVVVVVKNGQILTERGFGYSDVAAHKLVDPALNLFRPGSISKLFTWTAVMQLVEAGKIDLDAPVNKYLDYKLPDWNGKPITMRNLMTHTPGFEEIGRGLIVNSPTPPYTLGANLKARIPAQVYEPGTTPAYSNYGAGVAGYVVERVSGEKYEDYVQKHILQPLGMNHSTFVQPLPDDLKPLMTKGYRPGSRDPQPFEDVTEPPAGALTTSGEDIAQFMIAHLHHGAGLLKPETADEMHNTILRVLPDGSGAALGFGQSNRNGHNIIGHGGATKWFHSLLSLLTDDDVGVFLSCNSPGNANGVGAIQSGFMQGFMDRYFPAPLPERKSIDAKEAADHARMMEGYYISSRRNDSSFLRAAEVFGQQKVSIDPNGRLITGQKGADGQIIHWVEIAPFVWANETGPEKISAKAVDGKIVMWGPGGPAMSQPVPWYRLASWLRPATFAALAALLLTALFWPASAYVRRQYGARLELDGSALKAYRAIGVMSVLTIAVFLCWGSVLGSMSLEQMLEPTAGMVAKTYAAEIGTFIVLPLLLAAGMWNAFAAWTGARSLWARLWSLLLVAGAGVLIWTAAIYNLFSFGLWA